MNVAVSPDFKQIKLNIEFLLDNLQLLQDIQEEKLCYAIHIECPITTYRREFQTKERVCQEFCVNRFNKQHRIAA